MTSFIADVLFPKHCLACGSLGSFICISCQHSLRFVRNQVCFYCKKPSLHGLTHTVCRKNNGVDECVTVFRYDPTLKRIIKGIKYRLVSRAIPELLTIATPHIMDELLWLKKAHHYAIQPVPLHNARYRERGFNQSYYIGLYLSSHLGLRLTDNIERVKKTQAQARLPDIKTRHENVQEAFYMRKNTESPENIMIVDDVITSGATIVQVATLFKKNNTKRVFAFSLAI